MATTKRLLSNATTREQALTALQTAAENNWSEASIRRHASKAVLALMSQSSVTSGGGARALKQRAAQPQLPVVRLTPTQAPKRARRPNAAEIEWKHKVPVTLTRDGETFEGMLVLADPREKKNGAGLTIDAMIGGDRFTISSDGMQKLAAGGNYGVWLKGHRHEMALLQN